MTYQRILLKLSGEALMGTKEFGIDDALLVDLALAIKDVHSLGVEIAIVPGGGNIFRGITSEGRGIDRVVGDEIGMLATVINALALMSALEAQGLEVRVQTAIEMQQVAEPFILRRALRHLEQGRIVIFGAGTGNPFFSTDTAAALRASQINASALLMAKNGTDGVYDCDPNQHKNAKRLTSVSYAQLLHLDVMDTAATALAQEQRMPIVIFDFADLSNLRRVVTGEDVGTLINE